MKKYNLLKIIGISFFIFAVLTWIIPVGTYSGSTLTATETNPVGIFDFFRTPLITFGTFVQYALVFLCIGGFYGVLERTGAYSKLLNRVSKIFHEKSIIFVVISVLFFAIFGSLTALSLPLFAFVPFFMAVLLLLGYSKVTAFASTVGAILVGLMGSTYGFNVSGYVNNFLEIDVHNEIIAKVILLIIFILLFLVCIITKAKKEVKVVKESKKPNKTNSKKEVVHETKVEEIPFYTRESNEKKSYWPMIIIFSVIILFVMFGMYNWYYAFELETFKDAYTSFMGIEIDGYPIVANIIGSLSQFGVWGNYDLAAFLIIASLLIGWIYSIKLDDMIDSFVTGVKKMLPTAFYVVVASVIFATIINNASGASISNTITNYILAMSDKFNVLVTTLTAMASSLFYNDFYYLLNSLESVLLGKFDAATLPVVGLIFQSIYGLAMMILPTSLVLIAGMTFAGVSFKEWTSYIWKFLLQALLIIIVVAFIIAKFI